MHPMVWMIAALSMSLFSAVAVRAEDSMQLAVVSYGKIPAGAAFQTELVENSELASQVEARLKKALSDRGFNPAADGGSVQLLARPLEPLRISGRYVDQYVGINEDHFTS